LLSGNLFKKLAKYHQAEEFSHFGSSLSKDASIDLLLGKQIYAALQQPPEQLYTLVQQQLILEIIMRGEGKIEIDVEGLKKEVITVSSRVKDVKDEQNFDIIEEELFKKHAKQPPQPAPQPTAPATPPPPANKKEEKAHAKS
jgi:F0F1-type ATP synthase alpha subunit